MRYITAVVHVRAGANSHTYRYETLLGIVLKGAPQTGKAISHGKGAAALRDRQCRQHVKCYPPMSQAQRWRKNNRALSSIDWGIWGRVQQPRSQASEYRRRWRKGGIDDLWSSILLNRRGFLSWRQTSSSKRRFVTEADKAQRSSMTWNEGYSSCWRGDLSEYRYRHYLRMGDV